MKSRIYLSPPHLGPDALEFIQTAVGSNWIAPLGPDVDAFEKELSEVVGVEHVVTTNSGTSAIHLGLLALGVGPGDEVICSTFTFCASVNPVVYCGASPVFVDSERETWNMDPILLEEAIKDRIRSTGRKPRAIVVVHLYGMPAQMAPIIELSRKYAIPVLEDSAEALGSTYQGRHAGSWGDIGILSFNGNKIITTSGGGALFTSNADLASRVRYLRAEAKEPFPYYEHKEVGYNYRLSNLLAALGRSQLRVLSSRVKRRREIFDYYSDDLGSIPGITFQGQSTDMQANRWLTAIVLGGNSSRSEEIRLALEAEDIESRPLWKPMHLQPVFKDCPFYGNGVSTDLFNRGLCLPSGSDMKAEDLKRVTDIIKQHPA